MSYNQYVMLNVMCLLRQHAQLVLQSVAQSDLGSTGFKYDVLLLFPFIVFSLLTFILTVIQFASIIQCPLYTSGCGSYPCFSNSTI